MNCFIADWLANNPSFGVYIFGMVQVRQYIICLGTSIGGSHRDVLCIRSSMYIGYLFHLCYLLTAYGVWCPQVHRAIIRMERLRAEARAKRP